jgi:amino acid adenylation domain-containing protein
VARPLPLSVRGLDRDRLLRLDAPDRLTALADVLCDLYLFLTGQEDDDGDLDRTEPLILESLAADMSATLEGRLGVSVPISTPLMEGLSITQLAGLLARALSDEALARQHAAAAVRHRIVPDPAARHEDFPLAEIQQAYRLGRDPVFEQGDVSAYLHIELTVTDFDVRRAERALHHLIERHDMLRSVVTRDGRQRVLRDVPPYRIEVADLSARAPADAGRAVADERARMTRRTTRPDLWQPFEVRVLQLSARQARLLVSLDPVKLDGWSARLLLAEWFGRYEDPRWEPPEIAVSFRDYVIWSQKVEETRSYHRSRQYWLGRLPSLPPAPELPVTGDALGSLTRPRFVPHRAGLDPDTWARLKERADVEGLTPSIMLCAAYADVLARWSRTQRFTLSVTGGRPPAHPHIARVIGPFARPTLLEVDGTVPGGFAERARALRRRYDRDVEHWEFGGLEVLRELARTRGMTRATMPVIFTSVLPQGGEDGGNGGGGLRAPQRLAEEPYIEWGMPRLLLENQVRELDGALIITWMAVEQPFPEGVVAEMFQAYVRLLERLATSDGAWHERSPDLLPRAQAESRTAANRTTVRLPTGLLHSPFADQVAERGDAPAVISSRRTLDYNELYHRAGDIAMRLRARGVLPNTLVGVCMHRGWEQVVAVLATLRAGAAYLPIDPDLPTRRLHYLLGHGDVRHVLTQPWVDERLPWPAGVERIRIGADDAGAVGGWSGEEVARPSDLAYVIFTSEATGPPKGVMIEHRAALNTILDVNRRFAVGPDDRVLALSALGIDLSVYDIFGTLAAGGAIVVPDAERATDPAHWSELIHRERVSVWNSVPALLEMLLEALVEHRPARADALRLALLSGDPIPIGLPERVWRRFTDVRMVGLGGATEAAVWSIAHPITPGDTGRRGIPYGRPLANQRLHVLNQRLDASPDLVAGELFIGGAGVATAYWRDTARTLACFVTHPDTGERLYRTGDVARHLRDGEIEFLGRAAIRSR